MSWCTFTTPLVLRISGKDATRYLNARLTNDIKKLKQHEWCEAAALSPQGRIEGYFTVIACTPEPQASYIVWCDGGNHSEILSAFIRYKVADRVDITNCSDQYILYHATGTDVEAALNKLQITRPSNERETSLVLTPETQSISSVALTKKRHVLSGIDILILRNEPCIFEGEQLTVAQQLKERAYALKPQFPDELSYDLLFASTPLKHAVSFTKGCYAGQEVVERIDAQGRVPSVLKVYSLAGNNNPAPGTQLLEHTVNGENTSVILGEVVSSAYNETDDTSYLFALVKTKSIGAQATIAGRQVHELS
jgi:folate-binding protein YgfZ